MTTLMLIFAIPLAVSLLASELFAVQPWLTKATVRLVAKLDADDPGEVNGIYAEHMDGIDRLPGHAWGLLTAVGLLFKVAIARRTRAGTLAARCAIQTRIGLARVALARRRAKPDPITPTSRTVDDVIRNMFASISEAAELLGRVENSAMRIDLVKQLVHHAANLDPSAHELIRLFAHSEIAKPSDVMNGPSQRGEITHDGRQGLNEQAEDFKPRSAVASRRGRRGYGDALSPRQLEIVALIAQGLTNRQIGKALFVSPKTVEIHVGTAMRKLKVKSRTTLAIAAREAGLLTPEPDAC